VPDKKKPLNGAALSFEGEPPQISMICDGTVNSYTRRSPSNPSWAHHIQGEPPMAVIPDVEIHDEVSAIKLTAT
jgi:hypothetical protein